MYAIEFETDINSKTLAIPADVAAEIGQGRHVRIIMLLDERKPAQTDPKSAVKNPTAALLESELIGCAEADPELSRNYKAELGKSLGEKYGYR
ncbi:MAG: hypothetical protein GY862_23790 [Gammaproteobacteria bacterium]|nr:hypothetical protein [Gammaproteobacteria bacterium]